MRGSSAVVSAGVNLRAVRKQPGNRPVIALVGEPLQRSAFAVALAVTGYTPVGLSGSVGTCRKCPP
jgi:hypothetical protein